MTVAQQLKNINWLRNRVKRGKVFREYYADARFMSRHLLDGGRSDEHEQYRIMLGVHSLEKGLSHRNPRAYGAEKALALVGAMARASDAARSSSAYRMGLDVLQAWVAFHDQNSWGDVSTIDAVRRFLVHEGAAHEAKGSSGVKVINGRDPYQWSSMPIDSFITTRHSTRRYANEAIGQDELDECVRLAMTSPSACNRQMIRLRVFDEPDGKKLLYRTLHGTGGIDYDTSRLGVVTFDAQSLNFCGERNQGYLNAGLFAMTLIYAFHWRGIGSCLLQFGNTFSEERMLVEKLGIPPAERISVGIAFGRLEFSDVVPASARRKVGEVVSIHGVGKAVT